MSHFFVETFSSPERAAHSTLEAALAGYLDGPRSSATKFSHDDNIPLYPTGNQFNDLWPQSQSQSLTRSTTSLQSAALVRNSMGRSPETSNVINELGLVMKILCQNIPRSVNSDTLMKERYVTFILAQRKCLSSNKGNPILQSQHLDDLHRVPMFFQRPPLSMVTMLAARIKQSGVTLWLLYLGAKIFEQLNENPRNAAVRPLVYWINKCDQQITKALDPNCSVEVLQDQLSGLLEVSRRC